MLMHEPSQQLEPLMISGPEVARILSISSRHFQKMRRKGLVPAPQRFGRAVRWGLLEIREWLKAGCPPQKEWESLKACGEVAVTI